MAARAEPHSVRGREVVFSHTPVTPVPKGPREPICCLSKGPRPCRAAEGKADLWGQGIPSSVSSAGREARVRGSGGRAQDRCKHAFLKACGCRAAPKTAASGQQVASPCRGPMGFPFPLQCTWGTNFLTILITLCWPAACKRCALCHG